MKILSFQGKSDTETYLEWEKKVEFIFECHQYSEVKKVKLAAVEFTDYALVQWDQLMTSKWRIHEPPIKIYDKMKAIMHEGLFLHTIIENCIINFKTLYKDLKV